MDLIAKTGRTGAPAQTNYTRLRDLIRADIVEGRLPSGARLKIDEIARRYDSSAIPVREALQQLQGEGVVVFLPNRGAWVRRVDADFLRNIHEVRALTEPYLLRWFVRHRTEAQLEALVAAQAAYDRSVDEEEPDRWHGRNLIFHSICYDGHYNREALAIAKRHTELLHTVAMKYPVSRARALQSPDQPDRESLSAQIELAQRIVREQPDDALQALRRMLSEPAQIEGKVR